MCETVEERTPEMSGMGFPVWWHHHGTKMKLIAQGICNDLLIIQGSAAELVIGRIGALWSASWKVIHDPHTQVTGQAIFGNNDLLAAFGFMDRVGKLSKWLIDRYGGSAADQRKFIRYRDWLNIPCPGTGHDGDPNISIKIDDHIRKAVKELVYNCR